MDIQMSLFSRQPLSGFALLVVMLLWESPGVALDMTVPQQIPLAASQPKVNTQDVTATAAAQFNRTQWQLSETEWQRYQMLMQGIRGSISPKSLSPLEVLGIHAETAQERQKYARLWAKLMREDVERTLAFQKAYQEATLELYGKEPLFDPALLTSMTAAKSDAHSLQDHDRLLVFIKASSCQQCTVLSHKRS